MTYYANGCRFYDTITNPFLNEYGDVYYLRYDHGSDDWNSDFVSVCNSAEYINLEEVLFY